MSKRYRIALIDLDGTLWRGGKVIPGAPEFVQRVRTQGIVPVFLTNNASRTPHDVVTILRTMGIGASEDEICTSAQAAAAMVQSKLPRGSTVAYIGQSGLRDALVEAGFIAKRATAEALSEGWVNEASAAVVGLDTGVCYMDLAVIARVARRLGWFVLTNRDVRLPVEDGFLPGNGSIGALVAMAAGVEPMATGKPEVHFMEYALRRYQATAAEAIVIGDNLETDILAGKRLGMDSILVLTGVSRRVEEGDPQPDQIVDSIENIFRQK